MFEKTANYIENNSVTLVEDDGVSLLPKYVKDIPEESVICIFYTHVANQLQADGHGRWFKWLLKSEKTM